MHLTILFNDFRKKGVVERIGQSVNLKTFQILYFIFSWQRKHSDNFTRFLPINLIWGQTQAILSFFIKSDAIKQASMRMSKEYMPLKIDRSPQADLDKTQFKFNRKQNPGRQSGKKYRVLNTEDRNFCYMSPGRITKLLSSPNSSVTAGLSPSSSHYLGSPLHDDESFIKKMEDGNQSCKMNDSLLSICNQLDVERKIRQEVQHLREEVGRLTRLVEEFKSAEVIYKSRLEEVNTLQQFLMQRQSYICQVHEENIQLVEKNSKISKEKELLLKQNEYLRKLLQREKEQNQQGIKKYQKQCQFYKNQHDNLKNIYDKLQDQFKRNNSDVFRLDQSNSLQPSIIQQEDFDHNDSLLLDGPFQLTSLPKMSSPRQPPQNRRSYKELLSSRSGKNRNSFEDDGQQNGPRHRQCSRGCDCGNIIESLSQKLRYNDIQIDILKRMKAKGESYRQQNDKLKKQNAHLFSRIDIMKERKRERRRKDSDQILQFSLSPLKSKSKSKKW